MHRGRSRSRSRSRQPAEPVEECTLEPALEKKLLAFRERYPFDDRALDFLKKSPPEVTLTVLSDFRPKREGESSYSALLTNFVRMVRARVGRSTRGRDDPYGHGDRRVDRSSERQDSREREKAPGRDGADGGRHRGKDSREPCKARLDRRRRRLKSELSSDEDGAANGQGPSGSSCSESESDSDSDSSVSSKCASSSCSSSGSVSNIERAAKLKSGLRLSQIAADAEEEKRRKVEDAEMEEMRIKEAKIASGIAEAEQEKQDKLADYEERLESEKLTKIDQITFLAETAAKERVHMVRLEAEAERARKVEDAEADSELELRKARDVMEDKELNRRKRLLEKTERQKLRKEGQKDKDKAAGKEKRRDKAQRAEKARKRRAAGGRREHRARRVRTGERPSREASRGRAREGARGRPRRRERSKGRRHTRDRRRARREGDDAESCEEGRGLHSRSRDRGRGRDRSREGSPHKPGEAELNAFRDRYPMDSRAFANLTSAPPAVQRSVLKEFKPRREGEDDYSALVASFVRSILVRTENKRGLRRERGRDSGDRESSPLGLFRSRYPMDQRAFSVLERAPPRVRATVVSDFRPRHEGEDDYSALVMSFVRAVQARLGCDRERPRSRSGSPGPD
mmetsp:Transcript_54152/g.116960  ORF Transcript_54152/g.116960 Transcript_54152/m.116960 type:complete len:628 (+) Transcript_54152:100-1983(+)